MKVLFTPTNKRMDQSVFPILAYEENLSRFVDNGTGFLINEDGYFISAGHVFKNETRNYFAFVNSENYPIEIIYREYLEGSDQVVPIYLDLVIGRIRDVKIEEDKCLSFSTDIKVKDELTLFGYSPRDLISSGSAILPVENYGESLPKFKSLSVICDRLSIWRKRDTGIIWFTNCLTIFMHNILAFGMSGGPIVDSGNNVFGMLITRDSCLSSMYIISILEKNNIKYKYINKPCT